MYSYLLASIINSYYWMLALWPTLSVMGIRTSFIGIPPKPWTGTISLTFFCILTLLSRRVEIGGEWHRWGGFQVCFVFSFLRFKMGWYNAALIAHRMKSHPVKIPPTAINISSNGASQHFFLFMEWQSQLSLNFLRLSTTITMPYRQ